MSHSGLLTSGCIAEIMRGTEMEKPVVQILASKRIDEGGEQPRYRLLLSDGQNRESYVLFSRKLQQKDDLAEFTVIRIDQYALTAINLSEKGTRQVLVIFNYHVVKPGAAVGEHIGDPQSMTEMATGKGTGGDDTASTSSVPIRTESARTITNDSAYQNRSKGGLQSGTSSSCDNNMSFGNTSIHPINSISPHQKNLVIRARVTSKSNIRFWNKANSQGKFFTMDVKDESGEILITAFQEQCDKYYGMIEVGKVYYITKCKLKLANKKYYRKHTCEMLITNETIIKECKDAPK